MVKMGVAVEQDFDIGGIVAELYDIVPDLLALARHAAVDHDMALRGRDEEHAQPARADEVNPPLALSDHAKRFDIFKPCLVKFLEVEIRCLRAACRHGGDGGRIFCRLHHCAGSEAANPNYQTIFDCPHPSLHFSLLMKRWQAMPTTILRKTEPSPRPSGTSVRSGLPRLWCPAPNRIARLRRIGTDGFHQHGRSSGSPPD